MSVLACLSLSAPAVRDLMVARLESNTEDMRLKVYITVIYHLTPSWCSSGGPDRPTDRLSGGAARNVQLLLGINPDISLAEASTTSTSQGDKDSQPEPVQGESCLGPVLRLLGL